MVQTLFSEWLLSVAHPVIVVSLFGPAYPETISLKYLICFAQHFLPTLFISNWSRVPWYLFTNSLPSARSATPITLMHLKCLGSLILQPLFGKSNSKRQQNHQARTSYKSFQYQLETIRKHSQHLGYTQDPLADIYVFFSRCLSTVCGRGAGCAFGIRKRVFQQAFDVDFHCSSQSAAGNGCWWLWCFPFAWRLMDQHDAPTDGWGLSHDVFCILALDVDLKKF